MKIRRVCREHYCHLPRTPNPAVVEPYLLGEDDRLSSFGFGDKKRCYCDVFPYSDLGSMMGESTANAGRYPGGGSGLDASVVRAGACAGWGGARTALLWM